MLASAVAVIYAATHTRQSTVKLAIIVYGSPTVSRSHSSALRFARAALTAGHEIVRVFFYHDAVVVGGSLNVVPQDEVDVGQAWADLARHGSVELCICISAALRRGVLDETEAERYERSAANVRAPFQIVGLGQLTAATIDADRVITFAA